MTSSIRAGSPNGAECRVVRRLRGASLVVLFLIVTSASSAQTLIPATGGENIPPPVSPFTSLTGPTYSEGRAGDVGVGSIVLELPAGFEWDTAAPFPEAELVRLNPTFPGGRNINNLPDGGILQATSVTASQITFQITQTSTGQRRNRLVFRNLRVRRLPSPADAVGDIVHTGTSALAGVVPGSTSWGRLGRSSIVLSANGDSVGPVIVQVGMQVSFAVNAIGCTTANAWIDTWNVNGTPQLWNAFATSPCQRSPVQVTGTFNTPGNFTVEFVSESCSFVFFGLCFGRTEFGRDSIEVIVQDMIPDHIRILHPGSGLTCQPSELTILACQDPGCTSLSSNPVLVNLSPSGASWSSNPVSFTGQTTVQLQVTTPGIVTLSATSEPAANGITRCFVGGTETCDMEWFDSGFVIDVPDHVSATVQTGTVAAVRTDNQSQTCAAGFANEARDVKFWSDYLNPASGSVPVLINGLPITGSSPGTPVTLSFDGNGVAAIGVRYDDAGMVALNARFDGSGNEAGLVMTGRDTFVARPDTFTLAIPGNPQAVDASGPVFVAAGTDFRIDVQARNANGAITPNFGRETPAETVALENAVLAPTGGNNPALVGGFGAFGDDCNGNPAPGGTACGDFNWPEVGTIEITPRLSSGAYLATTDVIGSPHGPVGRFIPSHFALSAGLLTDRVDLAACTDNFTYVGERFGASWTLTARNAQGARTRNYQGAFARLNANALGIAADEAITVDQSSVAWLDGEGAASATIRADRNQPAGPFVSFRIGTSPVDLDGVTLNLFDVDLAGNDGVDDHGLIGATELRFGRLAVDNAIGSELGPLALPLRAEYFVNDTWQINALDDCTELSLIDDVKLNSSNGDNGDGTRAMGIGSGTTMIQEADPVVVSAGTAQFTFSAPGSPGWVALELLLGPGWPFLRDDLDDDGNFLENPNARASFGLFDGDGNRILIQEITPR